MHDVQTWSKRPNYEPQGILYPPLGCELGSDINVPEALRLVKREMEARALL